MLYNHDIHATHDPLGVEKNEMDNRAEDALQQSEERE